MSETDALKELADLKASLSYEFWDACAYVALFAVFLGVVGESVVELSNLVKDATWKARLAKGSALILIAGLGGDITTHAKNTANTGIITEFLNRQAAQAYQVGNEARARAAKLESDNLKLRQDLAGQGGRIGTLENRTADRDIEARQNRIVRRGINGHRHPVVIMRLNDREPRAFAGKVDKLLTTAHFTVTEADFGQTSPLIGVIVCENDGAEVKLFRVLKAAGIAKERRATTDRYVNGHPAECSSDFEHRGALRIFVGQKE